MTVTARHKKQTQIEYNGKLVSIDAIECYERVYNIVSDDFSNYGDMERKKYAKSVFDRAFEDLEKRKNP